ncbi:MAG: alpha/beta hydrolase [Gammaproteobacteria bacterium]
MVLGHELYGTGEEGVIVMHYFYGCRDTWAFARNFFDTRRFTWAFAEVRGYGESRHLVGEYTPAEAAADIIALADNLGWERFHIVGHSMSGMLAQRVVLDGGERVRSAVLNTPVAASGLSFTPEGFAIIEGSITSNAMLDQAFDALTGARLCPEWREFKIRQTRSTRLVAAQQGYLKNLTELGFLDDMRGNTTPMLVIVGEYDMEPFTETTARATFAAWYPNAEIVVCGNAGHYPQQEAPVFVATVMNAFLRGQPARGC